MKNYFLLSLLAIVLLGCQPSIKPNFTIQGTIEGEFDGYVYLKYKDLIDSALVDNGSFFFSGNIDYPVSAVLFPKNGATASDLYFGQENITLTVEPKGNVFYLNEIKGSKVIDGMESTLYSFREVLENNDYPAPKIFEMSKRLVEEDPTNPFYSDIILDLATDSEYYSISEVNQLIAAMAPSAIDPQSLEAVQTVLARMANLNVGDKFPSFELPTMDGKTVTSSSLKGSYVLVDLWASWCGPCRQEMPHLKALNDEYESLGFKLLGVNVDEDADEAKRAIDRLKIDFPVLFDSDNKVVEMFKVDAMPTTFIIDRDGNIRHLHRGYKPGYEVDYQEQVAELIKEF